MKNILYKLSAVMLAAMFAAGCGSASYDTAASVMTSADVAVTEEAAEIETEGAGAIETGTELSQIVQENRKLIRTVEMQIETKEFDSVLSEIGTKVTELGGYIENSSLDSGSLYYTSYNRYSSLKLRVPSDQLDSFVA